MPISKVSQVPLIAQRADGVCWCASAMMLYKWSTDSGHVGMKDPLADSGMKWRWENNKDWSSSDNAFLASTLAMKTHASMPADYSGLSTFFVSHGPIWAAGQKNWGGNDHGHVVVLCGVADTGVFIHDPEPVGNGSSFWLTWDQWKKYVDGFTASIQFLSAM